ncbi:MAG TPA: isocitrate/isopropylmalate dehydrogenase family protein [Rhodothermales bacterium]|nr:isocitrate/isopropylmalate dehydrogenase family protein [Rhodothermales bacterium]
MAYRVTLLPGDGIGPEVTAATTQVLEATGVSFEWERYDAVGADAMPLYGTPLPDFVLDSIRKNRVALKGPITTPVGKGFKSVNVSLRQKLDLYANVRPCSSIPGIASPFANVDLIIFRENTEDLYAGIETYDERLEIADSVARITRRGSERIIRFCLDYSTRQGYRKVTLAHKANILKIAHGMFLRIGQEIAAGYPNIEFDDRIIDALCMQLVTRPTTFQCIVTTNLFGDIISDLAAGLVGGLGVVAGANFGDTVAIFEAVHGSAPDIAGQNKANPTALIRSAEMMLRHLGETEAADALKQVLYDTFAEGKYVTSDLGGTCTTSEFADVISERVQLRVAA